jgi:hypothetical protein
MPDQCRTISLTLVLRCIRGISLLCKRDVDGRDKPGHDGGESAAVALRGSAFGRAPQGDGARLSPYPALPSN